MVLERGLGVATDLYRRNADECVGGKGVPVCVIGGLVRLVPAARSIDPTGLLCPVIMLVHILHLIWEGAELPRARAVGHRRLLFAAAWRPSPLPRWSSPVSRETVTRDGFWSLFHVKQGPVGTPPEETVPMYTHSHFARTAEWVGRKCRRGVTADSNVNGTYWALDRIDDLRLILDPRHLCVFYMKSSVCCV